MIVLLATAFLSLGLINLDGRSGWWRGQRRRLVIGVPLTLLYVYVAMPPLVFPQACTFLLVTFVPNAVYSTLAAARTFVLTQQVVLLRRGVSRRVAMPLGSSLSYAIGLAILGGFALLLAIAPVVDASGLRDVPSVTITADPSPSADRRHLRVVPAESAAFAGEKIVGQLGAYYRVGGYDIQVEGGRLVWVAPLEFQGTLQWLLRRTSPGVIVVNAEDPDASAELRIRAPMRYVPSARLNESLARHVYFRYGAEQILETTLQLDDRGDPRYLCTLGRPTIGWSGQRVTGVVIVDPASGAMERIDRRDFDHAPRWVSRIYPSDLALDYNAWFGLYVHGWWNAQLARRDVHVPAREEVFGVLADGGRFVWFVDHTSPQSTDQSMTGFTMMDTVSGALTYETASGGEFSSLGAERAVASNPLVRQARLMPTQPILYRIARSDVWAVPLIADTGKYQTLALVDAREGHVVVGDPSSAKPQDDAIARYAQFVGERPSKSGAPSAPARRRGGIVDRIAAAPGGTVYLTLRGSGTIYAIAAASSVDALLARSGDYVDLELRGSGDDHRIDVARFTDRALRR